MGGLVVEETRIVVKLAPMKSRASAMPAISGRSMIPLEYSVKKSKPAWDNFCSISARELSRANLWRKDCSDSWGFIRETISKQRRKESTITPSKSIKTNSDCMVFDCNIYVKSNSRVVVL